MPAASKSAKRRGRAPNDSAGNLAISPALSPREEPAATQIARKLEEDIVLGRRLPRERLVEQDLCEEYGTHRADVRLALFELETRGIVRRIPNRGAIVRDLSPEEVSEIYAVRTELECMALRILPLPVPADALETLEALHRQRGDAIEASDFLAVHHTNAQFHRALYSLCGNACLIETIEALAQKVASIRSFANAQDGALKASQRDHADIIKALRKSRRDDLIEIVRRHLRPPVDAYTRAHRQRFPVGRA